MKNYQFFESVFYEVILYKIRVYLQIGVLIYVLKFIIYNKLILPVSCVHIT